MKQKKITTLKDDFEKLKVPLKSTLVAYVRKDTLSIMPLKIIETKKITTFGPGWSWMAWTWYESLNMGVYGRVFLGGESDGGIGKAVLKAV